MLVAVHAHVVNVAAVTGWCLVEVSLDDDDPSVVVVGAAEVEIVPDDDADVVAAVAEVNDACRDH